MTDRRAWFAGIHDIVLIVCGCVVAGIVTPAFLETIIAAGIADPGYNFGALLFAERSLGQSSIRVRQKSLETRSTRQGIPVLAQAHLGRVFLEQCLKARVIAEQVPSRSEAQHDRGNGSEPSARLQ